MKIEINIPDEEIKEAISKVIAETIMSKYTEKNYALNHWGIELAVKDVVYTQKKEIVEKVIERATREIVKKGVPRLLENFSKGIK